MPRYHFNIYSDYEPPIIDKKGAELPDSDIAWQLATRTAEERLSNLQSESKHGHLWRLEVTDELLRSLYVIEVRAHIPYGATPPQRTPPLMNKLD